MADDWESGNFSKEFNEMPFMQVEADIAAHRLNDEERSAVDTARETYREATTQEIDQFGNPDIYQERVDTEFARLLENHQPTPEGPPPPVGGPTQPTEADLYNQAQNNIISAHEGQLDAYGTDYTTAVYDVLDRCAADGRGPEPESPTLTQDFNRAVEPEPEP